MGILIDTDSCEGLFRLGHERTRHGVRSASEELVMLSSTQIRLDATCCSEADKLMGRIGV